MPDDLRYVLDHLQELVVKEVQGSGGYGMLIGPGGEQAEIEAFRARIRANPVELHRAADACRSPPARPSSRAASRRATSTCGPSCSPASEVKLVPGGLTRVALKEGSLVVNSSQGGGTKDTWVVATEMMLSRVGDRIYWMSRFMERAENIARILGVTSQRGPVQHAGDAGAEPARAAHDHRDRAKPISSRHDKLYAARADRFHGARRRQPVVASTRA